MSIQAARVVEVTVGELFKRVKVPGLAVNIMEPLYS